VSENDDGTPGSGATEPPRGLSYADWATAQFTSEQLEDPDTAGPEADPNADGVNNLTAYAFGLSPWSLEPGYLPALQVDEDGGWIVSYRRQGNSRDLNYMLQWSADLEHWAPSGGTEEVTATHADGTRTVALRVDDPQLEGLPTGSFRMRIYLDDPLFIGPPILQ
jgi:hypothetical protein